MNEYAAAEPKAACSVEGCENEMAGEITSWQKPPITVTGDEPPVMKIVPVCAEHHAEHEAMGAVEFFKKHPLKAAL